MTKITEQQAEYVLRIILMQKLLVQDKITSIETDSSLSPEQKMILLPEILNPAKGS